MKRSSFRRKSSAEAGRNTFTKKSVSSDNLSAHNPKPSTVTKPANPSQQAVICSTVGGSTFGRQNAFDENDMRFNRGTDKKSMLLKPGFLTKKSVPSDKLSAHNPKPSTVTKPANPSKPAVLCSTVGGSTFGRQNSFDSNDMRFNRGTDKNSMLLKLRLSSKQSVSSDNLSAHNPKPSTVTKPANPSQQAVICSTVGGSTFGRQNAFDENDMRFNRGTDKKSMLLKPGFLTKKSVSSDKLSAHNPKPSTVTKPANPSKPAVLCSTIGGSTFGRQNSFDSNDMRFNRGTDKNSMLLKLRLSSKQSVSSDNLSARDSKQSSTPFAITPAFNPNLPGLNSSHKNRRSNSESRHSSYGVVKMRKEVRPLVEKEFQHAAIYKIQNYFLTSQNASHILNNGSLKPMTTIMFTNMCEYLLYKLDCNQVFNKSKYMDELPKILKKYYYKGKIDRSWLITVNASHSFPQVVGLLLWLVELCETQDGFNAMEILYPSIQDPDEADCEQKIEFKIFLPFLLNTYQVESRDSDKPADIEFLLKQEEQMVHNYKRTLGIDEEALIKLDAEVAKNNEELYLLCDTTEEQKLEELKSIKVDLQKDITTKQKNIKDIQICIGEIQENIKIKTHNCVLREGEIENLQKELNVVNGCINGQKFTQEDKKIIEDGIIILKQDLQYEEKCLEEYSNIVYTEDFNVVNVRFRLDKLFVQYNKMCAENFGLLPELENVIADKNVLAMHVRESLKEIDELLKGLKNKIVEKLKPTEQKAAYLLMELESEIINYNNLKSISEKLDSELDADRKKLIEITDRQFEARNEYANKLFEVETEIKSITLNNTKVETKTEERNSSYKLINEMEKEKEHIVMKITNSLKNHVKLIEETKTLVEASLVERNEMMSTIHNDIINN